MTPQERIAAALAKREAQKQAEAAAFAEQQATDIEALVELEAEHGFDRILRIDIKGWRPGSGAATLVAAKIPTGSSSLVRRYEQRVARAKQGTTEILDAGEQLAKACVVYPALDSELGKATLDLAPGILANVALQVIRHVQGEAEEEKKG